jgi:hypothetical protein
LAARQVCPSDVLPKRGSLVHAFQARKGKGCINLLFFPFFAHIA